MNTEKDNKTALLDTSGKRKPDRHLTTSVNREPTHTDQYLAYDSDHLESVKHGNVRCLFDRAKRLVTKSSVTSEEKKHLSSVLVSNGYLSSFEQKVTKTRNCSLSREHVTQFKSTAVLPYVKGVSEPLRRRLKQQGVHADFRSGTTIRSHLLWLKDIVNPDWRDSVVYRIPCECSKIYIGETGRPIQERMKEHERWRLG